MCCSQVVELFVPLLPAAEWKGQSDQGRGRKKDFLPDYLEVIPVRGVEQI